MLETVLKWLLVSERLQDFTIQIFFMNQVRSVVITSKIGFG